MLVRLTQKSTLFILLALLPSVFPLWAQAKMDKAATEPELTSLFPLGGRSGTEVEVEIRGERLEGAYAIWFGGEGLRAQIKKVEEIDLPIPAENTQSSTQKKKMKQVTGHRVSLQMEIDSQARVGAHHLRVLSPRGISNALTFWVNSDPILAETNDPHHSPEKTQHVRVPVVINGQISESGEIDCYEFLARQGRELVFEFEGEGQATLYEVTGSWFDPNRVIRLDFVENLLPRYHETSHTQLTYPFPKSGRYVVKVTGASEPNPYYRLRIAPLEDATPQLASSRWHERSFSRRVEREWLLQVGSRSLTATATDTATSTATPTITRETEPNEAADQAPAVVVPSIIEGAIERPGDVDSFRFKVTKGERLAFEIETPATPYPYFNPRLRVLDQEGQEVLTNVYKRVPRTTMIYWKAPEAKVMYTFSEGGEYVLRIQDITSRHGEPDFQYRVLIRHQIPHVGEVQVIEYWQRTEDEEIDRINLVPGEAKKLTVVTHREEGFTGDIAITVENLPPGVQVIPATAMDDRGGLPQDQGQKERFMPDSRETTILIVASENAPLTVSPHLIHFEVRPVAEGRVGRYVKFGGEAPLKPMGLGQVGRPLAVTEVPLMVMRPPEAASVGEKSSSAQLVEKKR